MSLWVVLLTGLVFPQTMTIDQAETLVETYNSDVEPLPLRKFGEAFLVLAESQEA